MLMRYSTLIDSILLISGQWPDLYCGSYSSSVIAFCSTCSWLLQRATGVAVALYSLRRGYIAPHSRHLTNLATGTIMTI